MTRSPSGFRHPLFDHVALLHDGPDELAERLAPTVREAVTSGAAVSLRVAPATWQRLRGHLGELADTVGYLPAEPRYVRPAAAMSALHDFVRAAVRAGKSSVLSVGATPADGLHPPEWKRYEAAVDNVLEHLPLRGICAYDRAATPAPMLDAVECLHSHVVDGGRRRESTEWNGSTHPPFVTVERPAHRPQIREVVRDPRTARRLVGARFGALMSSDELADVSLAVSELVTNSLVHGVPPVELLGWYEPASRRIVVEVADRGAGLTDPLFDLRPPREGPGGAGLWIVGQLADRVGAERSPTGVNSVVFSRRLDVPGR